MQRGELGTKSVLVQNLYQYRICTSTESVLAEGGRTRMILILVRPPANANDSHSHLRHFTT